MTVKHIPNTARRARSRVKPSSEWRIGRPIHAIGFHRPDGELQIVSFFQTRQDAERAVRNRGFGYTIFSGYL